MPKTFGDYIGWAMFLIVVTGVIVFIRFLWYRAKPPKQGDERWLSYLFEEIQKRDDIIKKLRAEIVEQERQRDELKKKAQELTQLRREMGIEETQIPPPPELPPPLIAAPSPVLVATGADAMLKLDIAAFREVRTETGMGFVRVGNATLPELKYRLDLARSKGTPFTKLHLSVHAVPAGIELGGVLVDSEALSEILSDVQILVLAGCETTHVGAFLGVVPNVITFSEKISNDDAAFFCKAFWTQIGKRKSPQAALDKALSLSPSSLEEYIDYHFA